VLLASSPGRLSRARRLGRVALVAIAQVAAFVGVIVGTASPAAAFDAAAVIDAGGGTAAGQGIRIAYGSGQMQITRLNAGQYYGPTQQPGAATNNTIFNGIYLAVGSTVVGPLHSGISGSAAGLASWDTITTTGGSAGLSSGSINSTLSKTVGGLLYQVILKVDYTYPSDFYFMTYDVVVPAGNAATVKLYLGIDNYLGGLDTGPGFYRPGPTPMVGTYNATTVEAIRYTSGLPWTTYYEAFYGCIFKSSTGCNATGSPCSGAHRRC
jgi:hypothetical protein